MNSRLTYSEQIQREIARSRSSRDAARLMYYQQVGDVACVSWEQFRGSWAGCEWLKRNQSAIKQYLDEQNQRFGWAGQWR